MTPDLFLAWAAACAGAASLFAMVYMLGVLVFAELRRKK